VTALAPGFKGTWAPSVNDPERVSELGAPDGYTAVLAAWRMGESGAGWAPK
jgi:hypothetical protein